MAMTNDLPDPVTIGAISNQQTPGGSGSQPVATGQIGSVGGLQKERESVPAPFIDKGKVQELGQDIELSSEVSRVGVKVQPATVDFPPVISQIKIAPQGSSTPASVTVSMPLSDQQIALGLKQGISSSWRWLAEWCVRRLKLLHGTITGRK